MNELQILALEHVKKLSDKVAHDINVIGLEIQDEGLKMEKHLYPIANEGRDVSRWIDAIIKSVEK